MPRIVGPVQPPPAQRRNPGAIDARICAVLKGRHNRVEAFGGPG